MTRDVEQNKIFLGYYTRVIQLCNDEISANKQFPFQNVDDVVDSGICEGRLEFALQVLALLKKEEKK